MSSDEDTAGRPARDEREEWAAAMDREADQHPGASCALLKSIARCIRDGSFGPAPAPAERPALMAMHACYESTYLAKLEEVAAILGAADGDVVAAAKRALAAAERPQHDYSVPEEPLRCQQCGALFGTSAPCESAERPQDIPRSKPPRDCGMGVGCLESGVCYAAAHGEPDRCPRSEPAAGGDTIESLRAEVARLRVVIGLFGRHADSCQRAIYGVAAVGVTCTCGLDAAGIGEPAAGERGEVERLRAALTVELEWWEAAAALGQYALRSEQIDTRLKRIHAALRPSLGDLHAELAALQPEGMKEKLEERLFGEGGDDQ